MSFFVALYFTIYQLQNNNWKDSEMQDCYTPKGKQLTVVERRMIERWSYEGHSNREMARRLAKAPQTINNEIKRGQVRQQVRKRKYELVDSADFAQNLYETNRKRSVKQVSLKKELKEKILHYIKQKYSPEMMVKSKGIAVSVSTIYYWIHQGDLELTKADMLYPRRGKVKHKKQVSPYNLLESLLKNVLRASISVKILGILRLIRSLKHDLKTSAY